MFACLHGAGNLTALAFEFSPTVEQTAADTVTLDVGGLDRLFGLPQEIAAAMARRAAETRTEVPSLRWPPIPMPPSAPPVDSPAPASSRRAMRPSSWRPCRSAAGAHARAAGDAGALGHPPLSGSGRAAAPGHRRAARSGGTAPARAGPRRSRTQAAAAAGPPALRRPDRAGIPHRAAGAAGLPAGPPDQWTSHPPGHPRPGYRRAVAAPPTGKPRHPRAHLAAARSVARHQGVPETSTTRPGRASACLAN